MVPKAGSGCTGCGLCAEQCPAQAIRPDEFRKTDGEKCISCMRCVVRCPQGARNVNGALLSDGVHQYEDAAEELPGPGL